jgi:ABC-type multidrug transport system ATPase subunit
MVFQHADEALNLNATVRQTLRLVSAGHKKSNAGLMEALEILFTREEVMDIFKRKAAHLSGGQKQRLNLLRSFLTPAPLIILDEPFNGLDFQNLQRCVSFFREQQIHGRAMLLITHDEDIARVLTPPQMVFKLEAE